MLQLAKIFRLARVTARQAAQLLVMENFLTARQGRGIHVPQQLPVRPYENMRAPWQAMVKRIEGASLELLESADVLPCPLRASMTTTESG